MVSTATNVTANLGDLSGAGFQFARDMLSASNAAVDLTVTRVRDRLTQLRSTVQQSSTGLANLINRIGDSLFKLPNQLVDQLGDDVLDLVDGLKALSESVAPKDLVQAAIKSFGDVVDLISDGIENLGNDAATLAKLSQDVTVAMQDLVAPLIKLSQNTNTQIAALAVKGLESVRLLADDINESLKKIAELAVSATSTVANQLKDVVKNVVTQTLRLATEGLNRITSLATAAFEAKLQLDEKIIKEASNVFNSAKSLLNGVGLKASQLKTQVDNAIKTVGELAQNVRTNLKNLATNFVAQAGERAEKLSAELNGLFADATKQIQLAINSTSETARACGVSALADVQESVQLSQDAFVACSKGVSTAVGGALEGAMNQVTNALDGTASYFNATSTCIKNYQEGSAKTIVQQTAALSCVAAAPVSSALNAISSGLNTLFKDLETVGNQAMIDAETCGRTQLTAAETRIGNILDTLVTCTTPAA